MGRKGEEGEEGRRKEKGRGKGTEGMGGTRDDMGWDGEGRERGKGRGGKGRTGATVRGYSPQLQFLAPPMTGSCFHSMR